LRDVRRAYQPISEDLARPGLNAPGVRRVGERIGLKIASIEEAIQPDPALPPLDGRYDAAALRAGLRSTQAAAQSLILMLNRDLGRAAPYNRIIDDLRTWSQQLGAYQQFIEVGRPLLPQAQARFHLIRNAAREIGQHIERARLPRTIAASWNSVQTSLEAARVTLRLGPDYVVGTPPGISPEERLQRALVREYTGMIAEMDSFMAGLNDKVPEGPQIRSEALGLRDALNRLRRHTASGAPDRRIVQDLSAATDAQRVLAARVERVNQGRQPGPNVLLVRRIGEALARIQASAS
jgi:hypothetical protein